MAAPALRRPVQGRRLARNPQGRRARGEHGRRRRRVVYFPTRTGRRRPCCGSSSRRTAEIRGTPQTRGPAVVPDAPGPPRRTWPRSWDRCRPAAGSAWTCGRSPGGRPCWGTTTSCTCTGPNSCSAAAAVRGASCALGTGLLLARVRARGRPSSARCTTPRRTRTGGRVERFLLRRLDAATTLTVHLTTRTVGAVCPRSTAVVVPHGDYRAHHRDAPRAAPVPGRLVHPGLLRPYKGVEALLSAFAGVPTRPACTSSARPRTATSPAVCAGRRTRPPRPPGPAARRGRRARAGRDGRRTGRPALRPAGWVRGATARAVPGPARPAAGRPAAAELAAEVGPGWVHVYEGDLSAEDLAAALAAVRADARTGGAGRATGPVRPGLGGPGPRARRALPPAVGHRADHHTDAGPPVGAGRA